MLKNLSYKYNTIADFIQRLNYLESLFKAGKFGSKYKNIKLTTLHSSKGLEFDCVIMLDLYMSEIPGQQALDSYKKGKNLELLEEERRLFYVGMTRAREHIYLIFPQHKIGLIEARSIFIDEVIKIMDKNNTYSISEGLILNHKTFGKGAIISIKEEFSQTIIEVDFKGTRRILDLNFCIENNLISFDF
ncbi:MAG: 3'-5' exonuclease [Minisyncoccia bacterium]